MNTNQYNHLLALHRRSPEPPTLSYTELIELVEMGLIVRTEQDATQLTKRARYLLDHGYNVERNLWITSSGGDGRASF